jgi:selenocysteine-specific elongation factor
MKHVIAGTAGHIDHGKTALVRALTGIDTDRLEEEKRRGISIDLGFAHLDISDELRIALVDVPGHERFVKNMLAGAGGIDMVLFVIAADESIKPQSREHLDICRLLGIPAGVVALTKKDLVDRDILALVELEVQEFVRGTFLEGAPVIPVSSATGEGLAQLRQALESVAGTVHVKNVRRVFRMPVDRVFSMTGFGTVVTGTVIGGSVAVEDELRAYPRAATFRVRGVQVHGQNASRAIAGQRAAINLAGNRGDQLTRGVVLSPPGLFEPTMLVDCSLEVLPATDPIKNGVPVHFHAGTAEILGEVRVLEPDKTALEPGRSHLARIALRDSALLLPGDRFIIRRFSPVVTIGGGHIIDSHPPRANRVRAAARARSLDAASLAERIRILVEEAPSGVAISALAARMGESESDIGTALPNTVLAFGGPASWLLGSERFRAIVESVSARLREFHKANPLAPGIGKEELRTQNLPDGPPLVFDQLIQLTPAIVVRGEIARLKSHQVAFKADEQEALSRIESAFAAARLEVPALDEVLKASGVEPARARSLLQILLRDKRLVRVSDNLVYHVSALEELRRALRERQGQSFSVAQFKDWTGVSRKYAIPLLEFLDREKVTVRRAEVRVVL